MNNRPRVLRDENPRAHYFRSSERIDAYADYAEWDAHFSRLMGIQGKALAEELGDRNHKHHRYFNRFKVDHPDQLLLLHFNGNARDPAYETGGFFAGHWIYTNGATIVSALPAQRWVTEIEVSDATLFMEHIGRNYDLNEDVGICRIGTDGKPDWSHAEQVQIVSIHSERNRVKIRRGCFGTVPIELEPGEGYAAAHMVEGPWGGRGNNLMWLYNHSTACPRDERGRTCTDAIVEHLAAKFEPNGDLAHYDGVEFDVLFRTLFGHSYLGLQKLGPGENRAPDCDADGVADMGIVDGVDAYEIGVLEFSRRMREALPDRLVMADGMWHNVQRSFGLFNGVEVEGWPMDRDNHVQWSQGLNVLEFWRDNAAPPVFNYSKLSFRRIEAPLSNYRMIVAAALIADAGLAITEVPPGDPAELPPLWDELVGGEREELGWLGSPQGPAVHLAEQQSDLLDGAGLPPGEKLLGRLTSPDAALSVSGEGISIAAGTVGARRVGSASGDDGASGTPHASRNGALTLVLPDVAVTGPDLLVSVTLTADPMAAYPDECARIYNVSVLPNGERVTEAAHEYVFHKYAHANGAPFTARFYFALIEAERVDLEVVIEGREPALLRGLTVYAAPDLVVRRFDRGVVLANPSKGPHEFDLESLAPGRRLRRIRATRWQDHEHNNGETVGATLRLGAHDAILLEDDDE